MSRTIRYRVFQSRTTQYSDPIIFTKGEVVTIGQEYKGQEPWPGWVWCETADKNCWVPHQIVEKQGQGRVAIVEDYNAIELNVEKDDVIVADKELNGWIWGLNLNKSEYGWVPLDVLEEYSD